MLLKRSECELEPVQNALKIPIQIPTFFLIPLISFYIKYPPLKVKGLSNNRG